MHTWLMESKYGGVIISSLMVLLVGGFIGLVYYLHEAHNERQAQRVEMFGMAQDILRDSMKNEQERKAKLKEAKANRHPFHELWDAPYEGEEH